jgi:hypothetical protein
MDGDAGYRVTGYFRPNVASVIAFPLFGRVGQLRNAAFTQVNDEHCNIIKFVSIDPEHFDVLIGYTVEPGQQSEKQYRVGDRGIIAMVDDVNRLINHITSNELNHWLNNREITFGDGSYSLYSVRKRYHAMRVASIATFRNLVKQGHDGGQLQKCVTFS